MQYTEHYIKNNKLPLEWYKENINLAEFAQDVYGYTVNFKHTPRNITSGTKWISLVNRSTNDHVIIAKNRQEKGIEHYFYYNAWPSQKPAMFGDNSYDAGSIFDFVRFREDISLGQIIRKLKDYYLNPETYRGKETKQVILSGSTNKIKGKDIYEFYNVEPVSSNKFDFSIELLCKLRGIPLDALFHPKFSSLYLIKGTSFAKELPFLSFLIYSPTLKEVGFFGVNHVNRESIKHIFGSKGDGLWFSHFDKNAPVDGIYVMENPLDCISHYCINPNLHDKNVLYCATIGTISPAQIPTINKLIETYHPKEFVNACDFDEAGQGFNNYIISQINLKKDEFIFFESFQHVTKDNYANYQVYCSKGSMESNTLLYSQVNDFFTVLNKKMYNVTFPSQEFKLTPLKIEDKICSFSLSFYSNEINWNALSQFILDFKFSNDNGVKIEVPFSKDFNEDLEMITKSYLESFNKNMYCFDQVGELMQKINVVEIAKSVMGLTTFEDRNKLHSTSQILKDIIGDKSVKKKSVSRDLSIPTKKRFENKM